MSKLTSFYPCGWLQSWRSPFLLRGSENDFGDINVLSAWVYFKSDAYFILWHHLLTSKIPISVTAPTWYIHNSEIFVSKFGLGFYFGGYDDFGLKTLNNIVHFWVKNVFKQHRAGQILWYIKPQKHMQTSIYISCFCMCNITPNLMWPELIFNKHLSRKSVQSGRHSQWRLFVPTFMLSNKTHLSTFLTYQSHLVCSRI